MRPDERLAEINRPREARVAARREGRRAAATQREPRSTRDAAFTQLAKAAGLNYYVASLQAWLLLLPILVVAAGIVALVVILISR